MSCSFKTKVKPSEEGLTISTQKCNMLCYTKNPRSFSPQRKLLSTACTTHSDDLDALDLFLLSTIKWKLMDKNEVKRNTTTAAVVVIKGHDFKRSFQYDFKNRVIFLKRKMRVFQGFPFVHYPVTTFYILGSKS